MGNNQTEIISTSDNTGDVVNEYIVKFYTPYVFEGESVSQLDMRGLNDLTAGDMIKADRVLQKNGSTSFLPEMTLEYAIQLACQATKRPIEFFEQLPPRDAIRVKNMVIRFLFGQA